MDRTVMPSDKPFPMTAFVGRLVEHPHEGCVKQLRSSPVHRPRSSKILYSSPRLGGVRPGWASLVMLGGCGSLDASSNLAPGPRVRVALPRPEPFHSRIAASS